MRNAINKLRKPHVQWYVTAAFCGALTLAQVPFVVLALRSVIR